MAVLGHYYLIHSMLDCVQAAQEQDQSELPTSSSACDLSMTTAPILVVSTLTSAAMLAYKLGLIEAIRVRMSERQLLRDEVARLAEPATGREVAVENAPLHAPIVPQHTGSFIGPAASEVQHASQAASDAPEFIVSRLAPPLQGAAAAAAEVSVRGVCDGCGQDVLSNDEGRKREGDKYYHEGCVKGQCGGCGRVVHAESARASIRGVYWHAECL